jgi:predicted phosphatase
MRRLIFLDVDGVLNSHHFLKAQSERLSRESTLRTWDDRDEDMIDPAAVKLLAELVQRSGAFLVLSSSWRITRRLSHMRELLAGKGFPAPVPFIDKTPSTQKQRGYDIQAWLDSELAQGRLWPDGMVILDDSSDMVHLEPWLVRTEYPKGLQAEHVEKALEVLARPAPLRLRAVGGGRQ